MSGVSLALRLALPIGAALAMLPYAALGGQPWPWHPVTVDLDVYQFTGRLLLDGGDILTARTPDTYLAFIYPAFAALLCVPLVLVPYVPLQVIWTAGNVLAFTYVLRRVGLRGWPLALLATGLLLFAEPIRATISFGQINIFLMAMVIADLVPGERLLRRSRRRLLPEGVLTGFATAVKVTPALFVVALLVAGRQYPRWRPARNATITAGALTLGTAVLLPGESWGFWRQLLEGDTRTGPAHFLMNQSVLGAVLRILGDTPALHYVGLLLGALVGVVGAYAAALWLRRGKALLGVSLCGLAALLASPLSWSHHFVWIVPLAGALALDRGLPRGMRVVGLALAAWTASGLYKYVLPWGSEIELTYEPWQQALSVLAPALALVLVGMALVEGRRVRGPDAEPVQGSVAVQ